MLNGCGAASPQAWPVSTKPRASRFTIPLSQSVQGSAPIITKTPHAGRSVTTPSPSRIFTEVRRSSPISSTICERISIFTLSA